MAKKYYIEFNTKDMPGRIKATTVELGIDIIRDMNKQLSVNLCDHPSYTILEQYVLANPSKKAR